MKKIYLKVLLRRKILPAALFMSIFQLSYGQVANYIPPSPNAASLACFADVQVSEYTGIPSISIPVYTVQSGDISLPVTLNYHASGIKVEQEASWVGLGFSLSAVCCITRQIRGKDDFDMNGYAVTDALPPSTSANLPQWGTTQQNQEYMNDYGGIANGTLDGEPDLFYYNFNGHAGKLIFQKQTGTILTATPLSQSWIKFLYNRSTEKWEITDEKGVKYFFGTKETTTNYSWAGGDRYHPTTCYENSDMDRTLSWYLDSIRSPGGFSIDFTYENTYHQTISQVQRSELIYHQTDMRNIVASGGGYVSSNLQGRAELHTASMQEIHDVYLREISFADGKLIFTTGDRTDMASRFANKPQRLENIEVRDIDNSLIKTFNFQYSYFNPGQSTTNKLRLKLDRLYKIAGGVDLPPWEFSYNTMALPSKTSCSMDHWGFFNSKNNGRIRQYSYRDVKNYLDNSYGLQITSELGTTFDTTMVPYLEYKQDTNIFLNGADREPDALATQAGVLAKIKYPTGGSSEFEYEANQYSSTESLFADEAHSASASFYENEDP